MWRRLRRGPMLDVPLAPKATPALQNPSDPEREHLIDAAVRRACASWYDGDVTKLREISRQGITAFAAHPMFTRIVGSEFASLFDEQTRAAFNTHR